jgi:MaoC dehydratase-like protein
VRRVNPAMEGTVYPSVVFEVTEEHVDAFRAVVGGPGAVPPTFAAAAEFTAIPQIIEDPALGLDFAHVVHGSQVYEHRRPMRVGERLAVTPRIESIKTKGATAFLTIVMELVDQDAALVCISTSTMVERSDA